MLNTCQNANTSTTKAACQTAWNTLTGAYEKMLQDSTQSNCPQSCAYLTQKGGGVSKAWDVLQDWERSCLVPTAWECHVESARRFQQLSAVSLGACGEEP
ncbi:MAG: hypothetical protein JSR85_04320 [Proteobacteria bacterium]|nr:hypothetical protein [Pseudomonadota bacterium]